MPGLIAFGRRWQIGSDDFVIPGIFDLLIRIIWLIAAVVIYFKNDQNFNLDCEGGYHMKSYLHGVLIILQLTIINDIALVHNSKAGVIMDTTGTRKMVPLCIYIRAILAAFEIGWNIVGTMWFVKQKFACHDATEAKNLILGFLIFDWFLNVVTIVGVGMVFDPAGNKTYNSTTRLAKIWKRRWLVYSCQCLEKNEIPLSAFEEVGYLFAKLFGNWNLVPSDIHAGLVLIMLQHLEKCNEELNVSTHAQSSNEDTTSIMDTVIIPSVVANEPLNRKVSNSALEKYNLLSQLNYYMKYALAPNGLALLCVPERGRNYPLNVDGDNCCFCCTAAAKEMIQQDNSEIIYASFDSAIFETPFFVAVDHFTKSIIVSIRATMSIKDVITDGVAMPVPMGINGLPHTFKAHRGMLLCAKKLKEKLEKMQMLQKAFESYPDYNLVITGASLGGGTSAILGFMLRDQYPNLKCYTYATPGGLLSLDAAKYSESFVTTVIYGDDCYARLSLKSMYNLKCRITTAVQQCRTSKYRVILGGLNWLPGGFKRIVDENSIFFIQGGQMPSAHSEQSQQECNINVETESEICNSLLPTSPLMLEPLFLPGNILHITETSSFHLGHNNPSYTGKPRWRIRFAERNEFQEIIVSERITKDHLPFRMNKALLEFMRSSGNRNEMKPFSISGKHQD